MPDGMSSAGFKKGFLYGFATAAAQIEGGGEEKEKASGRGDSIWDLFCDEGSIEDGSHVKKTCNHYDLYKQDIKMMADLGVQAYRFSISWPRVIPDGGKDDPVNEKGLQFYDDVINECLKYGITPFATLYHWDLPLTLWNRYQGLLTPEKFVPDFIRYARICFERYGDRVKYWLTFNEPWCTAALGFGLGQFAPGRKNNTEPWIAGHAQILAHAHVAKMYRAEFKPTQKGELGITLNGDWTVPYDDSPENIKAAQDKMDVCVGWFADPIYLNGDYPESMRQMLGDRLPRFTEEEKKLILGSSDFYGMNFYTTHAIRRAGNDEMNGLAEMSFVKGDGTVLGPESSLGWLRDVPWGLREMLRYVRDRYKMPIYMTENGYAPKGEWDLPVDQAINDQDRVTYFKGYLSNLKAAIEEDGIDIRSYFGWSFIDNFEWNSGLRPRFGVFHTDYDTFKRTPKQSASYMIDFFKQNVPA